MGKKEYWRMRWLSSINELTSVELQRKSWLDKENTNPHWTFVEFMCCYFDDVIIHDNYENLLNSGWVSKEEFSIIADWHSKLDKYKSPNNDACISEEVLQDENWLQIVELGKTAKEKLGTLLPQNERNILMKSIDYEA